MIHLILGGARSGKSRYALDCAATLTAQQQLECHFMATAVAGDDEMRARIERHRQERDLGKLAWQTHEVGTALAASLTAQARADRLILVDCLTLWLSGVLCQEPPPSSTDMQGLRQALVETLTSVSGEMIIVSNEVGSGIVPLGELSRRFADEAGWLNQAVASVADRVTLVVAGLPLTLKG